MTVLHFLGHVKLLHIIILVSVILVVVPLVTHYYLLTVDLSSGHMHSAHSHLELGEDYSSLKASDLRVRVEELIHIKGSVSSELRDMEARRQKLQQDLQAYSKHIDQIKQELSHYQTELNRLKISVEQAQVAQREALQQNTPDLALPQRLTADILPDTLPSIPRSASRNCRMFSCFDHSRCSLTSGFPVYLYDPDRYAVMHDGWDVDGFLKTTLKQALGYNPHLTRDPKEACIYLVLVGEALASDSKHQQPLKHPLDAVALKRLPYWGGDGRNHVLLNLARRDLNTGAGDIFSKVDTGRAILVQSTFNFASFRPHFDLIVSPVLGPPGGDVWQECAAMLPARRKYLLSFQGEMRAGSPKAVSEATGFYDGDDADRDNIQELDAYIVQHLKEMEHGDTSDKFYFQFECVPASDENPIGGIQDWALCGTDSSRKAVLKESTFVLIFAPGNSVLISTTLLQARLYEALRAGAIPVVLGGDQVELAYSEVIAWKKACIFLPRYHLYRPGDRD